VTINMNQELQHFFFLSSSAPSLVTCRTYFFAGERSFFESEGNF